LCDAQNFDLPAAWFLHLLPALVFAAQRGCFLAAFFLAGFFLGAFFLGAFFFAAFFFAMYYPYVVHANKSID
jgi:hypothetical protein